MKSIPIEFLDGPLPAGRETNGAALHEVALPSRTVGRPVFSPGAKPGVRQCLPSINNCPAAKGTRGHSLLGLLIGFNQRLALSVAGLAFGLCPGSVRAAFFVPRYSRRWDRWEFWRSVLTGSLRRNTCGGRLVWLLGVNGGLQ